MSKADPHVQKYMTTQPYSIEADKTLADADKEMSQHNIRHLPVMEDGKIIGIISDRDMKMASGLSDVEPSLVRVKDICHEHPYIVDPQDHLKDVAATMADKRYGSALVVQNGKLVGILTTVDICKALVKTLEDRFHPHL